MEKIFRLFCLDFSLGILSAMLLIRRNDLVSTFFKNTGFVALGVFGIYAYLTWAESVRSLWPGVVMLAYVLGIRWAPPILGKLLLGVSCIGLILTINRELDIIKSNIYIYILELTSCILGGLVMGFSLTAMNIGHSYLSTVKLPMRPLRTAVAAIGVLILLRISLIGIGVWLTGWDSLMGYISGLGVEGISIVSILTARFLFGIVGVGFLTILVWKTVEIESTQSATGILYALLMMALVGELSSLFLTLYSPVWF